MKKTLIRFLSGSLIIALSLATGACRKKEPAALLPSHDQNRETAQLARAAGQARSRIVATVNGVDISMAELIREMNLADQSTTGSAHTGKSWTMDAVRKRALDSLIFRELVVQEAAKQGITVSPQRIDDVIGQMKKLMGPDAEYRRYLQERGLTEADLRRRIERGHRFELMTAKEIYQKIAVDEGDMRKDYEMNKGMYRDSASRQLTYDEARPFIGKKLAARAGEAKTAEWVQQLRKKAQIVIAKN
jgi:hypothetical protein